MAAEDDLNALYAAVGFLTANWAIAEQGLDGCIAIVYQELRVRGPKDTIPRSLKKKVEFLRKSLNSLPALAQVKNEGLEVMTEVTRLATVRHDLVHGAIKELRAKDGKFSFARIDYHDQIHSMRDVEFDLTKFPALSIEFVDLGSRVFALALSLLALAQAHPKYRRRHQP